MLLKGCGDRGVVLRGCGASRVVLRGCDVKGCGASRLATVEPSTKYLFWN